MKKQQYLTSITFFVLLILLPVVVYSQVKKPAAVKAKTARAKSTVPKSGSANSDKPGPAKSAKAAPKAKPATGPKKTQAPAPPPPPPPIPKHPAEAPEAKTPSASTYNNPFRKGTISFTNRVPASYSSYKTFDVVTEGTASTYQVRAEVNYFFMDHLAIGADLRYSKTRQVVSTELNYDSWASYLNLTYGRSITPRLNIYARVGGGVGGNHLTDVGLGGTQIPGQNNPGKSKELHGTLGIPLALEQNSSAFLTPYVNYQYFKNEAILTITDKTLSFGIRLESYIDPRDAKGAQKYDRHHLPVKGASFFEANTTTSFSFINEEQQQHTGTTLPTIIKYRNGAFGIGYHYYVTDYLAAGLNIGLSSNNTQQGGGTTRAKGWSLQPMITLNAPVAGALHNLFFQIGYGWERINDNGIPNHNTYFPLRLGYDLFIAKNISFSPKIGYQHNVVDRIYSNATSEHKESGFAAELAVRAWLNPRLFR